MKQIVIEAPNPGYGSSQHEAVFLGGGISDCPDWQGYFINKLQFFVEEYTIYNPRRCGFDMTDPDQSRIQIDWEHNHLDAASVIVFWFPKETLCPITLFELGKYCRDRSKHLIVGCHTEYKRRMDVVEQMKLVRPGLFVHSNLNDMVNELHYHLTY